MPFSTTNVLVMWWILNSVVYCHPDSKLLVGFSMDGALIFFSVIPNLDLISYGEQFIMKLFIILYCELYLQTVLNEDEW